jgi:hypothetical protein
MNTATVCSLFLALCVGPVAAIAQENAEVGFHYAYHSVAVSNENGAAVYGEYFLKRNSPHLHGRSTVGVIGEFDGSGSGSGSLYTYLFGVRLNTEWRKSHLVLHADYKAGGAHVRVNGVTAMGSSASFVRNSFAWDIAGVGLDLRIGHHFVVTLLQTDFPAMEVPASVSGVASWQGDMRISGGIGFRFDRIH